MSVTHCINQVVLAQFNKVHIDLLSCLNNTVQRSVDNSQTIRQPDISECMMGSMYMLLMVTCQLYCTY